MTFLIWIRYFAELCMYFGVALVFRKVFSADVSPLIVSLVLSLTIALSSVISKRGNDRFRFLTL